MGQIYAEQQYKNYLNHPVEKLRMVGSMQSPKNI